MSAAPEPVAAAVLRRLESSPEPADFEGPRGLQLALFQAPGVTDAESESLESASGGDSTGRWLVGPPRTSIASGTAGTPPDAEAQRQPWDRAVANMRSVALLVSLAPEDVEWVERFLDESWSMTERSPGVDVEVQRRALDQVGRSDEAMFTAALESGEADPWL